MSSPHVVAMGGGHGLAATLRALRSLTEEITAVVTVADNGGSSGRLRKEFNSLPPGDLRMALAALCSDDEWGSRWAEVIQHRFSSTGEMDGHAVGNLLLTALWDRDSDAVAGLDQVGALLKVIGRVLPMTTTPLDIQATFRDNDGSQVVRGQVEVATASGHIEKLEKLEKLELIPAQPPATPEVLTAIETADWLTFGPGSWLSSVMPHFLLQEQAMAIAKSTAKKIFILNLHEGAKGAEFAGFSPTEHLNLILHYLPQLHIDYAIADSGLFVSDHGSPDQERRKLQEVVEKCGGSLVVANVAQSAGSFHHDSQKLSLVFDHIFSGTLLR